MVGRERALVALGLVLAGCAAPPYAPCPVELDQPPPADAFARCREVLLRRYQDLAVADEVGFRLQTEWVPVQDPVGERRATVYREGGAASGGLVVVVELRWLAAPWFGLPNWSQPRGDATAERALAAELQAALGAVSVSAN